MKPFKKKPRKEDDEDITLDKVPFITWLLIFIVLGLIVWSISSILTYMFNIPTLPFFYCGLVGFAIFSIALLKNIQS
jgi:hypothetical protein